MSKSPLDVPEYLRIALLVVKEQTIPSLRRSGGDGHADALETVLMALSEAHDEISDLRDRWACVECGRTPDGGESGDLYVSICHGCHRCMSCAEPMCTICGDVTGTRERAIDLYATLRRVQKAIEPYRPTDDPEAKR